MNKYIKKQLDQCSKALIPSYDDDTTQILIPKIMHSFVATDSQQLQINKFYLITVEDYIIHPYDGFTLHENWNNGIIPKDKVMKAVVTQIMGKMVKVDAVGYDYSTKTDTSNTWSGWLPIKSIKILKDD